MRESERERKQERLYPRDKPEKVFACAQCMVVTPLSSLFSHWYLVFLVQAAGSIPPFPFFIGIRLCSDAVHGGEVILKHSSILNLLWYNSGTQLLAPKNQIPVAEKREDAGNTLCTVHEQKPTMCNSGDNHLSMI